MTQARLRHSCFVAALAVVVVAPGGGAPSSAQPLSWDPRYGAPLFECRFVSGAHALEGPFTYLYDAPKNQVRVIRQGLAAGHVPDLVNHMAGTRAITFSGFTPWGGAEFMTVITAGSDFGRARITRHFVYSDDGAGMAMSTSEGSCRHTGQVRMPT